MVDPIRDVKFTVNAAFFQEIKDDHQMLRDLLDKLRERVEQPESLTNHLRQYAGLLADLRDQLAFHFTLEEAYGYIEDAVERAPRFHEQAGRLREQHSELYLMAERIAENASEVLSSPTATVDAGKLAEQFIAFDRALSAHESAELGLILDAIQVDVGVGD